MVTRPNRKLLLVAYHFPPIQGSTGTNRTIAFARYLKKYGWDVSVLTITARAYEDTAEANKGLIPEHIHVTRAWGFDARKQLAIMGRYPLIFAIPDRWQSWIVGGYFAGRKIIRAWAPDAIMSTYPIPSAHVLGYCLHRNSGIPWIAEFRDPMLQPKYPSGSWQRKSFSRIEQLVFKNAAHVVVTTDGCRRMYLNRYPEFPTDRISTISNGYDPAIFNEHDRKPLKPRNGRLVFLHSGLLYPHERNPGEFFRAVQSLSQQGLLDNPEVEFRFRASGNEDNYREITKTLTIDHCVTFLPRLTYAEAVQEMQAADALMIFQADNCNDQIPAKVYEYLYARKPILGLADPKGDTGMLLKELGFTRIAKLEDSEHIEAELQGFLDDMRRGQSFVAPMVEVEKFSRVSLTARLGHVLSIASETL